MTDFIVVIATATAMLAAPAAPAPGAAVTAAPGAAASAPLAAPTVGFRVYADAVSCEQATAALTAPPGTRLVCVPVESTTGEMASAF